MAKKKEQTIEERLNAEKKSAWENFKNLKYDKMTDKERLTASRNLYETMSQYPTPPAVEIGYDFWKEYENTEEIKEVKRFMDSVDRALATIPQNPTKDVWLDRERGIVPNLKREWKTKLDPFKNERTLQKKLQQKAEEFARAPENKDKDFSINIPEETKKALENIEKTAYLPTRQKIESIETEIKKRVQ